MPQSPSNPDDIRKAGWSVAVHNDYRLKGEFHTFWLFTKPIEWFQNLDIQASVKGEGRSDAEALNQIRKKIRLPELGAKKKGTSK